MARATILALALAAAGPATAQDGADLGRREYMAGCAVCHGLEGRGDGVMAPYLTLPAPDLTAIARDNGGIFPAGLIAEIIEGGGSIAVHGTSEMPAWGDRYSAEAYHMLGWPHEPEERAAFVRARILALVEYLASIQAE
jgi:mono/diheme cytochrome c family protein